MPDGDDGGALRKQLEAALAENKRLKQKVLTGTGAYGLVKDTDLSDLKADQPFEEWEARAKEIQGARQEEQKELLKKAGLSDEAVQKVLAGQKVEPTEGPEASAVRRITALGAVGGGKAPTAAETGSFGYGKILEHFKDQAKSK